MKLLLTSNFPMKNNHLVAERVFSLIDEKAKLLFIGYNDSTEKYSALVQQYGFPIVDYLNLSKGFSASKIIEYNCLLLHGGNPFSIKQILDETGFFDFLRNSSKLIITVSGSTCVLSRQFPLLASFYPAWKGENAYGYGFFGFETLPHLHRYKKHQEIIKEYAKDRIVYGIPDGSAVAYVNGEIELIGKASILQGT